MHLRVKKKQKIEEAKVTKHQWLKSSKQTTRYHCGLKATFQASELMTYQLPVLGLAPTSLGSSQFIGWNWCHRFVIKLILSYFQTVVHVSSNYAFKIVPKATCFFFCFQTRAPRFSRNIQAKTAQGMDFRSHLSGGAGRQAGHGPQGPRHGRRSSRWPLQ